jgi:hypothetical protein
MANQRRFVLIILLLVSVVACRWAKGDSENPPVESFEANIYLPDIENTYEISSIEGNAEIIFPSSSHEIYAYTTGFREIDIKVRFSIDADEIIVFLNTTLCKEPVIEFSPDRVSVFESDLSWWTPFQGEVLRECTGKSEYSRQHIIVDMTNADIYIIYVDTGTG